MKVDILAFGAHPDDVELGCAATLAKEISFGKKVGIIDLTRGELGTRGSAEIREAEAKKAAEILKVAFRINLGFSDGFFTNDLKNQMEIIRIIRKFRPEIVLCNAISDRHIDHAKGSKLVSDACFLSGLRKIETQEGGIQQTEWRPKHVYHYIQWQNLKPDFIVEVNDFIQTKVESVMAYKSQFYDPHSEEPVSPIATRNFLESITYRARDLGRLIGAEYGEGFTAEREIAVVSLDKLI